MTAIATKLLHCTVGPRLAPMLDIFEHSRSVVFTAQFLIGLVNSQMSAGNIVMDIGNVQDFVAKIKRDEQLVKKMTSPPLTRMPKMAENTIVIEEEVIDVKKQCSGNAVVVRQFVGFEIDNQLAERWVSALEIMDSVGL